MSAMFVATEWVEAVRIGEQIKRFYVKSNFLPRFWVTFITKMLMPMFFSFWEFDSDTESSAISFKCSQS